MHRGSWRTYRFWPPAGPPLQEKARVLNTQHSLLPPSRCPSLAKYNRWQGSSWMQSIRVKSPDLPLTLFRPVQWKSVESGSAGQTEGSQHLAVFLFLMYWHRFSRHQNPLTTSLQHTLIRVIYCFSSHILQLCEPFLKARVPTFSFIFLILFPHLCLVSSSFKSEYKCHLPFAAHLINPPTLLAP